MVLKSFHLLYLQRLLYERQGDFSKGKCAASEVRTVIDLIIEHLGKMKKQEEAQYAALVDGDSAKKGRPNDRLSARLTEISEFTIKNLLPGTEIKSSFSNCHNNFPAHYRPL